MKSIKVGDSSCVAELVKKALIKAGSKRFLSKCIGVTRRSISNWLSGECDMKRANWQALLKYAESPSSNEKGTRRK